MVGPLDVRQGHRPLHQPPENVRTLSPAAPKIWPKMSGIFTAFRCVLLILVWLGQLLSILSGVLMKITAKSWLE